MPAVKKLARESKSQTGPANETKLQKKRRAGILKAAARVFLEKGYEAASMAEIIAKAGGSKATLYDYFESKEGLFEAVMREEILRRAKVAFDIPRDTHEPDRVLLDVGVRFVQLLLDDRSRSFWIISMHDASNFPGVGQAFYESGPRVVHQRIAEFLTRATENGDLCALNAIQAAEQFCLLCEAGLVLPYLLRLIPKPNPEAVVAEVETAVGVFMAAYGVRPASIERARAIAQRGAALRPSVPTDDPSDAA